MPRPEDDGRWRGGHWALRVLRVRRHEVAPVLLAAAYFFCLLSAWYLVRPLREAMGLSGGVRNLPWLYLCTLTVMLVASPLFSALVSRFRRGVFIPVVYVFAVSNLAVFYWLFSVLPESDRVTAARVFYVWASVFNLFAVSVFWSFMADLFRPQQGKRLFGLIGVGGTLGAIIGSFVASKAATHIGEINLILVSMILLLTACGIVVLLNGWAARWHRRRRCGRIGGADASDSEAPIHGSIWAGMVQVARSPYLLKVCLWLFLMTLGSTFVYFQQARLVADAFESTAERVEVFGKINFLVNAVSIVIQILLTSRIIARFGVGGALAVLPIVTAFGFLGFGLAPTLAVLIAFQTCRRAMNYAVAKPARESLFTVVSREQKYKSKNFIDTFVYRGGDAIGAAGFKLLTGQAIGLGLAGVSFLAVPVAVAWIGLSLSLGRHQRRIQTGQRGRPVASVESNAE